MMYTTPKAVSAESRGRVRLPSALGISKAKPASTEYKGLADSTLEAAPMLTKVAGRQRIVRSLSVVRLQV